MVNTKRNLGKISTLIVAKTKSSLGVVERLKYCLEGASIIRSVTLVGRPTVHMAKEVAVLITQASGYYPSYNYYYS